MAAEDFSFTGTFNYSAFPLNIFETCFSWGKTRWSEIRHNLTDGRRDFQEHLKDTWGGKTPLWSQLQEGQSKQFTWAASYADPNPGETYATGAPLSWRQLLGTFTDVYLGQRAHKLALISRLSSKNGTILCFLQRAWKWKILHSLVAYSRASQLWWAALGASIFGVPVLGHRSGASSALSTSLLKIKQFVLNLWKCRHLAFFECLGPGDLQSHRPLILFSFYSTVGRCDEFHFWCFSLVNSKKKLLILMSTLLSLSYSLSVYGIA